MVQSFETTHTGGGDEPTEQQHCSNSRLDLMDSKQTEEPCRNSERVREDVGERTISLIKMSLHVAEISFDISGHLHAQLLVEFPLLLYLRYMRAETE